MEYYLAIKKKGIMLFAATWMGLEINIGSEVRQKNIIWYHLYMESKKIDTNELLYETRLTDVENKHGYQLRRGKRLN